MIAEYSVTAAGSNVADPNSARVLLSFDQPQFNHDAGFVGFGPDDLLYITTGDGGGGGDNEPGHTGGGANDPTGGLGNSQDRSNLLGKVLRIDPLGTNADRNSEIFLFSNMTPQRPQFNRRIWSDLEEAVRDLIRSGKYAGSGLVRGGNSVTNAPAPRICRASPRCAAG